MFNTVEKLKSQLVHDKEETKREKIKIKLRLSASGTLSFDLDNEMSLLAKR